MTMKYKDSFLKKILFVFFFFLLSFPLQAADRSHTDYNQGVGAFCYDSSLDGIGPLAGGLGCGDGYSSLPAAQGLGDDTGYLGDKLPPLNLPLGPWYQNDLPDSQRSFYGGEVEPPPLEPRAGALRCPDWDSPLPKAQGLGDDLGSLGYGYSESSVAAAKKVHQFLGIDDVAFIQKYLEEKGAKRKFPIDCPHCSCVTLRSVQDLDKHLYTELKRKPYICSCCGDFGESFLSYASFKIHLGTQYHTRNMQKGQPPKRPRKASGPGPEARVIPPIYPALAGVSYPPEPPSLEPLDSVLDCGDGYSSLPAAPDLGDTLHFDCGKKAVSGLPLCNLPLEPSRESDPSDRSVAPAKKSHRPLGLNDIAFIQKYLQEKKDRKEEKMPLSCPHCSCATLRSVADLEKHFSTELKKNPYRCCGESFSTYHLFVNHLGSAYHKRNMEEGPHLKKPRKASGLSTEAGVTNLPEPPIYQELAGTLHRSLNISEYRIIRDFYFQNDKNARCPFCRQDFEAFSYFQDHLVKKGELSRPYYCKTCKKGFKTTGPFEAHCLGPRHIKRSAKEGDEGKHDDEV